jgi:hypothetical protein
MTNHRNTRGSSNLTASDQACISLGRQDDPSMDQAPEFMSEEELTHEINRLHERVYTLQDQLAAARLARAGIMNILQARQEGSRYGA